MASPKVSSTTDQTPPVSVDLSALSLQQALIDFEVANARVLDLTRRLTTQNVEIVRLSNLVEEMRLQLHSHHQAQIDAVNSLADIRSSRAYQATRMLGLARAKLSR
jgi:hypothetical protein